MAGGVQVAEGEPVEGLASGRGEARRSGGQAGNLEAHGGGDQARLQPQAGAVAVPLREDGVVRPECGGWPHGRDGVGCGLADRSGRERCRAAPMLAKE